MPEVPGGCMPPRSRSDKCRTWRGEWLADVGAVPMHNAQQSGHNPETTELAPSRRHHGLQLGIYDIPRESMVHCCLLAKQVLLQPVGPPMLQGL